MRLFIDCDDTLILWRYKYQEGVVVSNGYRPNTKLIDAIDHFISHNPDTILIIWSGGGIDYASRWAMEYLGDFSYAVLPKDIRIPKLGDLVVDDQELKVAGTLLTWESFVAGALVEELEY